MSGAGPVRSFPWSLFRRLLYSGHDKSRNNLKTLAIRNDRRALFFVLLALCFFYLHHPHPGSGVNARLDTTFALVENGTLSIDAYHGNTHDKTLVAGRFYSDKAPLLSFLAVPAYAAMRVVTRAAGTERTFRVKGYLVTALTVTLMSLLLIAVIYQHLLVYDQDGPRIFLVTVYALGTLAFPYSILFFNHQPAALLCFAAFVFAYRRVRNEGAGIRDTALAGLLGGLAILMEHPAGLIVIFLLGYLLTATRKPREVLAYLFLAFAVPAVLLGIYNQVAFGSPFHMGYDSPYLDLYADRMDRGWFGISVLSWSALRLVLLSPSRGLLFLSPILLLALPGLARMVRDPARRREGWLIVAVALGHVLFNASYHQPGGGACFGPRHLVVIIPFLMVPVYVLLADRRAVWGWSAAILGTVSVLIVTCATAVDPMIPERISNPLLEFMPLVAASGDQIDNLVLFAGIDSPWSLAPLAAMALALLALAIIDLGRGRASSEPAGSAWKRRLPAAIVAACLLGYALSTLIVKTDQGVLHQSFGNYYSARQDFAKAVEAYERAAALRDDPYIRYYQGRGFLKLGDGRRALEAYREVLRTAPDFPEREEVEALIEELTR